jgi:hypothetical protein
MIKMKYFPFFLGVFAGLIAVLILLILDPDFSLLIKIVIILSNILVGIAIGFITSNKKMNEIENNNL